MLPLVELLLARVALVGSPLVVPLPLLRRTPSPKG